MWGKMGVVFAMLVALGACSFGHDVSGQIFVVTNGRDNVKLALVDVQAVDADSFVQFVKSKRGEWTERRKRLWGQVEELQERSNRIVNNMGSNSVPEKTGAFSGFMSAMQSSMQLNATEAISSKVMEQYKDVSTGKDGAIFYSRSYTGQIAEAKSDAEGKFSLHLPESKKVVLVAHGARSTLGKTEDYYWYILYDPSTAKSPLMLSNHNVSGSRDCGECAISEEILYKLLG